MIITKDSLRDPWKQVEFIGFVNRKLEKSIKNYEKANDGKIPEKERAEYEKKYQDLTDEVENILKSIGISVTWPGLWPVYLVNEYQEHNLDRAIKEVLKFN
jgi:hypothetical protein